jgi:hypothetical protein
MTVRPFRREVRRHAGDRHARLGADAGVDSLFTLSDFSSTLEDYEAEKSAAALRSL